MPFEIPYDEEAKCEKCGRIGQNTLEKEEFSIVGNSPETAETHFVVCKCGNELYEIEDLEEEREWQNQ